MKWWKRTILAVMLAAVSAAATTIAPALYWRKKGIPPNYASSSPFEYWDVHDGQMVTWATETARFSVRVVEVLGTGQREPGVLQEKLARSPVPRWADLPTDASAFSWYGEGYGFPCVALWTSRCLIFGRFNSLAFEMRELATFRMAGEEWTLPTRVYWLGVLLNTVFFATLWGLALIVISAGLQRRRRRCGQCLKCGYDVRTIGGEVCPECGTPVAKRAAA